MTEKITKEKALDLLAEKGWKLETMLEIKFTDELSWDDRDSSDTLLIPPSWLKHLKLVKLWVLDNDTEYTTFDEEQFDDLLDWENIPEIEEPK